VVPDADSEVRRITDRARFLGRPRSTRNPVAMEGGIALSGTVGSVLDPVFSLRQRIRVEPAASAVLALTTADPNGGPSNLPVSTPVAQYRSKSMIRQNAQRNASVVLLA